MNDIAKRSFFALILTGVLLFGAVAFLARYFLFSDRWVSFQGNPHVYSEGVMKSNNKVYDRSGTLVLDTEGKKTYAGDSATRRAMLHVLGDRQGNIPSLVVPTYSPQMIGYDKLNGIYYGSEGGTLRLTLSAQVQVIASQALAGRRGTVGVYNYKTGEILCAVSSPNFDPDDPPSEVDDESGIYLYRFFRATYPPGSIFKLVTSLAAIESIPDIETQTFTCTGSTFYNGEEIHCHGVHNEVDFRHALAYSCNCAFADIANQVGKDKLSEVAARLGVSERFEVDGITTMRGKFDLSSAGANDLAWAGIGQYTDLINPYQYLRFMGAIAGGGVTVEPYLVSQAVNGERVTYEAAARSTGRLMQASTAAKLQQMMRFNVEEVYGSWSFPGLNVCAKSGTAELGSGVSTATFAGFVTDEAYPLAFIVIVEEGGAGSSTCIPIVNSVLQACVNVLDGEQ